MLSRLSRRYDKLTSPLRKILAQTTTTATTTRSNSSQSQHAAEDADQEHKYNNWNPHTKLAFGFALTTSVGLALKFLQDNQLAQCEEVHAEEDVPTLEKKIYSRAEVAEKKTVETGVWVIYGHNIYDITEFIELHPGGAEKIILAAGGNLEPFWDMYAQHKKQVVLDILEEYHVGVLREEDWIVEEKKEGPYAKDPKRHPALVINSAEPFNAETPPALAVETLITPNDLFYVRNHLPVPDIDENDFSLSIEGLGLEKPISLSVAELKSKFEQHRVVCAIQCAGNRRDEFNTVKPVRGLTWSSNAISNAEWTGVLLRDVLVDAGIDPKDASIKHIQFEGADCGPTGTPYGVSIPANRVFKKDTPVMIAFEMNGEPIPRDHGYPLRLVAPGIVGARQVKWLCRMILADEEYGGQWQARDYKPFSSNIDWHNVDFSSAPSIQELPVTSAICQPRPGTTFHIDDEEITAKGYAFSGGGSAVIRVDVSIDGGTNWHTAELTQADQELDEMYSWTLWKCTLPIPEDCGDKVEIAVRAVDYQCNTQPEGIGPVWNLRGCLNNSWHRVQVNIEKDEDEDEKD